MISVNALASCRDSYSCVVIVSDTTLISMPRYGAAALMNQSISASCWSLDRVLGVNSWETHFCAAALPRASVKSL
ncbi:hypothetical protein [Nonomuraea sp. NPDC048916]|uniref:hypothetical protein n=1 Tax=Nonomuraea sp. NPDC048916 TaxID=3154232 RepID=UPI00340B8973